MSTRLAYCTYIVLYTGDTHPVLFHDTSQLVLSGTRLIVTMTTA